MKLLSLFVLFTFLQSPLLVNAKEATSTKSTASYTSIQIYETDFLDRPFAVLGKVHIKGTNLKGISERTRKAALKYGGNAVLLYKTENPGKASFWTGGQVSYAEGVVVKFDEEGIKRITSETPIPVLE